MTDSSHPVFSDARNRQAVDAVVAQAQPRPSGEPRTWFLRIPAVLDAQRKAQWLNSNDRRNRYAQAHLVRTWREQAKYAALGARLPQDVTRVRFAFVFHYGNSSRKRDHHNLGPTVKAVIDGIVDAKFLPDDNDRHVAECSTAAGECLERPAISLTITEDPS